jgi:Holliday junction resolvase
VSNARLVGGQFERELLNGFRSIGLDAERLRLAGARDEGDLVVKGYGPLIYIIEAKNRAQIDLPSAIAESKIEALNYATARRLDPSSVEPLAIIKRRGKGWLDAYVVQDLRTYFGRGEG